MRYSERRHCDHHTLIFTVEFSPLHHKVLNVAPVAPRGPSSSYHLRHALHRNTFSRARMAPLFRWKPLQKVRESCVKRRAGRRRRRARVLHRNVHRSMLHHILSILT